MSAEKIGNFAHLRRTGALKAIWGTVAAFVLTCIVAGTDSKTFAEVPALAFIIVAIASVIAWILWLGFGDWGEGKGYGRSYAWFFMLPVFGLIWVGLALNRAPE